MIQDQNYYIQLVSIYTLIHSKPVNNHIATSPNCRNCTYNDFSNCSAFVPNLFYPHVQFPAITSNFLLTSGVSPKTTLTCLVQCSLLSHDVSNRNLYFNSEHMDLGKYAGHFNVVPWLDQLNATSTVHSSTL